eukprot:snap_masked-scaffold_46-processed-gene-1.56-mRNA-1 protein AED:1.00 eAED:1.00 QI:0/-1/0/0/-1/1/1/0/744
MFKLKILKKEDEKEKELITWINPKFTFRILRDEAYRHFYNGENLKSKDEYCLCDKDYTLWPLEMKIEDVLNEELYKNSTLYFMKISSCFNSILPKRKDCEDKKNEKLENKNSFFEPVFKDYKLRLWFLFTFFCVKRDPFKPFSMGRNSFINFCRKCKINKITKTELEIIFISQTKTKNKYQLDFNSFFNSLCQISLILYNKEFLTITHFKKILIENETFVQNEVIKLLQTKIFLFSSNFNFLKWKIKLEEFCKNWEKGTQDLLKHFEPVLYKIFCKFSSSNKEEEKSLSFNDFILFLKYFSLIDLFDSLSIICELFFSSCLFIITETMKNDNSNEEYLFVKLSPEIFNKKTIKEKISILSNINFKEFEISLLLISSLLEKNSEVSNFQNLLMKEYGNKLVLSQKKTIKPSMFNNKYCLQLFFIIEKIANSLQKSIENTFPLEDFHDLSIEFTKQLIHVIYYLNINLKTKINFLLREKQLKKNKFHDLVFKRTNWTEHNTNRLCDKLFEDIKNSKFKTEDIKKSEKLVKENLENSSEESEILIDKVKKVHYISNLFLTKEKEKLSFESSIKKEEKNNNKINIIQEKPKVEINIEKNILKDIDLYSQKVDSLSKLSGAIFLKHGKRGKPHNRYIWIDIKSFYLNWSYPKETINKNIKTSIQIQKKIDLRKLKSIHKFELIHKKTKPWISTLFYTNLIDQKNINKKTFRLKIVLEERTLLLDHHDPIIINNWYKTLDQLLNQLKIPN